jgi:hypothetical protein
LSRSEHRSDPRSRASGAYQQPRPFLDQRATIPRGERWGTIVADDLQHDVAIVADVESMRAERRRPRTGRSIDAHDGDAARGQVAPRVVVDDVTLRR